MKITERVLDAKTGEYFERDIELPGLMTEAEGIAKDAQDAIEAANAEIRAQLEIIDMKTIRPLRNGDLARVSALESQAEELRKKLK